VTLAWWRQTLR